MTNENNRDEKESLKDEVIKELSLSKNNRKTFNWSSVTVTTVLVVLSLVSVGQVVQSATILKKVENGDFGKASSKAVTTPSGIESLPDMVGGC